MPSRFRNRSYQKQNQPGLELLDRNLPFQPSFTAGSTVPAISRKSPCACGGGCPSCKGASQGLSVSQPTDASEIEADRLADFVMKMPSPKTARQTQRINPLGNNAAIQRKCSSCEKEDEEKVMRKALPYGGVAAAANSSAHVREAVRSGGTPLDRATRNFFEPRFGYDLSSVRVHSGGAAARSASAIDAEAYTVGSNIVFGEGRYQPHSESGRHLIAHELAHAVQGGTPAKLHRKKRGGAGGCGICMDNTEAGTIAHTEIRLAFAAANPEIRSVEFAVPVTDPGVPPPFVPEIDLSYDSNSSLGKTMHIGEIKPLDDAGKQVGIAREKLKDYARVVKENKSLGYDEVFRMRDKPPSHPIPFFNPNQPPGCPPQVIHVQLTEPGIYQYYCEPPWSDLVRLKTCACGKRRKKDEEELRKVVEKPEEKGSEEKKRDTDTPSDTGVPPYVVPAAIGVGVSAAAAAYLHKRAQDAAAKRAALAAEQAAWRKLAEEAAKKRAAAAAGKGAAGKVAGRAAAYVEIAAAAALVILFPDRVEASPGLGPSAIESLYKAMTTNGTPPSPELKELIESDPLLKQLAEEAGSTGDASKLNEEITRRTLQMIKDNPGMFTPEDMEFLAEYSKTASSSRVNPPATAEELKAAIEAAKAGKTAGESGIDLKKDVPADEKSVEKKPPETKDVRFEKLNDENKSKINGASKALKAVLERFIADEKKKEKLDNEFVKKFFETVPADLTEEQADKILDRLKSSPGQTPEQMLEALKKILVDIKAESEGTAEAGEGGQEAQQPAPTDPGKTREQIIADLKAQAMKLSFKSSKKGVYRISLNKEKIEDAKASSGAADGKFRLSAYIFGKNPKGVGVVGLLVGALPANLDVDKLSKGSTIKIEIVSLSPFVDRNGNVYDITLKGPLVIGL